MVADRISLRRASLIGLLGLRVSLSYAEPDRKRSLRHAGARAAGAVRRLADPQLRGSGPAAVLSVDERRSAAVFGHVLATNVVLCIALQAIAASCTYVLARRASGSTAVGVAGGHRRDRQLAAPLQHDEGHRPGRRDPVPVALRGRPDARASRGAGGVDGGRVPPAPRLRRIRRSRRRCVLLGACIESNPGEAVRAFAVYGVAAVACVVCRGCFTSQMVRRAAASMRAPRSGSSQSEGRRTARRGSATRSTTSSRSFRSAASCSHCQDAAAFAREHRRVRRASGRSPAHLASTSVLVLMMNAGVPARRAA